MRWQYWKLQATREFRQALLIHVQLYQPTNKLIWWALELFLDEVPYIVFHVFPWTIDAAAGSDALYFLFSRQRVEQNMASEMLPQQVHLLCIPRSSHCIKGHNQIRVLCTTDQIKLR